MEQLEANRDSNKLCMSILRSHVDLNYAERHWLFGYCVYSTLLCFSSGNMFYTQDGGMTDTHVLNVLFFVFFVYASHLVVFTHAQVASSYENSHVTNDNRWFYWILLGFGSSRIHVQK